MFFVVAILFHTKTQFHSLHSRWSWIHSSWRQVFWTSWMWIVFLLASQYFRMSMLLFNVPTSLNILKNHITWSQSHRICLGLPWSTSLTSYFDHIDSLSWRYFCMKRGNEFHKLFITLISMRKRIGAVSEKDEGPTKHWNLQ